METYTSWEDLLDEPDDRTVGSGKKKNSSFFLQDSLAESAIGAATETDESEDREKEKAFSELLERDDVPEEIKSLVRQHLRLKDRLDDVTQKKDNPYGLDDRLYRLYNLPVHTRESRLKQKQERHREEKAKTLEKSRLEKKVIEQKAFQSRLEKQEAAKQNEIKNRKVRKIIETNLLQQKVRQKEQIIAQTRLSDLLNHRWLSRREELRTESKRQARLKSAVELKKLEEREYNLHKSLLEKAMKKQAADRELMVKTNRHGSSRAHLNSAFLMSIESKISEYSHRSLVKKIEQKKQESFDELRRNQALLRLKMKREEDKKW